jgi:Xaa-Pro aminopeptidase
VQQLSRLTLVVDEAAAAAAALAPGAPLPAGYDIIAVQPLSERVLQQARGLRDASLCVSCRLAPTRSCKTGSAAV